MTTNKVEEMRERISSTHYDVVTGLDEELMVDPHKLAQVLVEMEKCIETIAFKVGVDALYPPPSGDYKSGFLAALEEIRNAFELWPPNYREPLYIFLDELKKKVE